MSGPNREDEALLEALGEVARAEPDVLDARWDALAAGALSADERAALEALAAGDRQMADALEAFAPRDDALDDRITAAILAQTAAGPAAPDTRDAPVVAIGTAPSARRRWAWLAAAGAALAAGLIAFALRGGPTLPDYALDNRAGEQAARGVDDPAAATVYGPGSRVDLILRPATDVIGPVAARVFHQHGDTISALPIAPTASATGVLRLTGSVDALLPPGQGAQRLLIAIGPPDALPKSVDALRAALLNEPRGWQLLRHEYRRR